MNKDDEYAKKLKERREAEERKLVERRKARNPILSTARELRSTMVYDNIKIPDKQKVSETQIINQEDVDRVVEESPVQKVVIEEAPIDESKEDKIARILKSRKEIYEKHREAIDFKYQEGRKKIQTALDEALKQAETEHKETLDSLKTDMDESLEDNEDAEERREIRNNYKEEVKSENENYNDSVKETRDEHKTSFQELKEEFETQLDELKEQYDSDVADIETEDFDDEDLQLTAKEFEAETISFDTLDQYDTDDSEDTSSDSGSSYDGGGGGIIKGAFMIIGGVIVATVGYQVFSTVIDAVETSQVNVTGTGMETMLNNSSTFLWIIMLIPMIFILFSVMKVFRGFDRY